MAVSHNRFRGNLLETLHTVSRLAKLGFYRWSADGESFHDVSEAYARLHGMSRKDFLLEYHNRESDIRRWIHPDDVDRYLAHDLAITRAPKPWSLEYRMLTVDGVIRHIVETAEPQFDDTGELTGWVGICQDITDRVQQETMRRSELTAAHENETRLRKKAEQAEQVKSEFLASMSHEIRTPMTGIMGMSDLLIAGKTLCEEDEIRVKHIKTATASLLQTINDILDISKIEAGRSELEISDFDLSNLVTDVSGLMQVHANAKAIEIKTTVAPNIPNCISCDPVRLRQVLLNLVGNAIKFTAHGTIGIAVSRADENLRFEISDTGIGIHEDKIDIIFNAFTQVDSGISRHYEGTGLGLSICKRLVDLLDGRIGAESEPDKGSTFWFEIPFRTGRPELSTPDVEGLVSLTHVGASQHKILVAEDNETNTMVLKSLLSINGFEAMFTENGQQAIDVFERGDFDLVLMDIRMPALNGIEAARIIRKHQGSKGDVPIIALTADAMVERIEECYAAGMNAVVTKPINPTELFSTISKYLNNKPVDAREN